MPLLEQALTGERLDNFVFRENHKGRRKISEDVLSHIRSESDKFAVVYGLRRTGKTVAMQQSICDMTESERKKTAFMTINKKDSIQGLLQELKKLENEGIRNIFIDEATFLNDYADICSIFYNYYEKSGFRIVLSGTNSLMFAFSEDSEAYDRSKRIDSTWIPVSEYNSLLEIEDMEEFFKCAGVLSPYGLPDEPHPFLDRDRTNRYVYTAIAENIQHSLENYRNGKRFGLLADLYDQDLLTDVIVRVVEDQNHRFLAKMINKEFRISSLSAAIGNFSKSDDIEVVAKAIQISAKVNIGKITNEAITLLKIKDKKVPFTTEQSNEIRQYLEMVDLIRPYHSVNWNNIENSGRNLFSQQGMRYSHLMAVLVIMEKKLKEFKLQDDEQALLMHAVRSSAFRWMTEDTVLMDTIGFYGKRNRVFHMSLPKGEFDMVVHDRENRACDVFEIKNGQYLDNRQCRDLENEDNDKFIELVCPGCEIRKYVLYNGEPCRKNDINYINILSYLSTIQDQTCSFRENMEKLTYTPWGSK